MQNNLVFTQNLSSKIEHVPIENVAFKNKTKTETLLYNIAKATCKSDTATIDYTIGGTRDHPLQPLNDKFVDNIILYYNITTNNTNNALNEATKYLGEYTLRIKRILNDLDILIDKRNIKPTHCKQINEQTIRQYVKVALADIPLNTVLQLVCNTTTIQLLHDNGLYVNDIDITQDFAGLICKQDVINYLLNNGFKLQGTEEYGDKIILDNDKYVGNNCLTFLTNSEYGTVRYKFYNKFVQSIESPSVRGNVGNHIDHWIENPEKILDEAISKSLETGILRLEITFYLTQHIPTKAYFVEHMDYLQTLLPNNLIWHNSISNQWKQYMDTIQYNMLILDIATNTALFVYSINSLTGKINGFFVKDTTNNKLNNIAKILTYNVPLIVLMYTNEDNILHVQQYTYRKTLLPRITKKFNMDTLCTYICSCTKTLQLATPSKRDPASRGFVDDVICRLRYCTHKNIAQIDTTKIPIAFELLEQPNIYFPTNGIRIQRKIDRENTLEEAFIEQRKEVFDKVSANNVQHSINVGSKTKHALIEEQKQRHDIIRKNIVETLKDCTIYKHFDNVDNGMKLYMYAYKQVSTLRTIMAVSFNPSINYNTKLELYILDKHTKQTLLPYLQLYVDLTDLGDNAHGFCCGKPFGCITKDGSKYDEQRHLQPVMYWEIDEDALDCSDNDIIDDTEQFFHIIEWDDKDKAKTLPKIDCVVNTGDTIKIVNVYKYKNAHIITIQVNESSENIICKSNKWIDMLLEQHDGPFNCIVSITKDNCISFIAPGLVKTEQINKFQHRLIQPKQPKIETLIKEGDVITILDTYPYKGSNLIKCSINGIEYTCKSNKWLDEILAGKENKFNCIVGGVKYNPKCKRSITSFTMENLA